MSWPLAAICALPVFVAVAYGLLVRHRRAALATELHELRQSVTAARLMIDVIDSFGETGPAGCAAAADEMANAYQAMVTFEDRLYAPLLRIPPSLRALRRRREAPAPARRGVIDSRSEFERLALIWGQAARAIGRSLEFDWHGGAARVAGSRKLLAEAAANLLSNAIRHGRGRVRIAARECGDVLRVEISDEGPGLSRPLVDLVSDGRRGLRRLGPHGHGLAVAVRAVERLGGRISGAPSAAGATLVMELPLAGKANAIEDGVLMDGPPAEPSPIGLPQPAGISGEDQ
ncbi:MAG: hypothetical protein HY827_06210 [Actinobacteria bacterium]|nr:hypothetical protein [Actinomycetota bacterium]